MPHDAFFELGLTELRRRRPSVSEATIRLQGSTVGAILHAGAAMAEEVEIQGVLEDEAGYLDTASGDRLTRLLASNRGVERNGATAARVAVTFERSETGARSITALTVIRHVDTGIQFTIDSPIGWLNGDGSDRSVVATASIIGPDGNVPAGSWVAVGSLGETMVITSSAQAAGGNGEEVDPDLIGRARYEDQRKVRGTRRAVEIGLTETAAIRDASVFESVDGAGIPSGGVTFVVADETGAANAELVAAGVLAIEEYRPLGAYPEGIAATARYEPLRLRATWSTGQATPENKRRLVAAAVARTNQLRARAAPEGATPEVDCILSASVIAEVRPLVPGLRSVDVEIPVGSVIPDFGEIIKTTAELVEVV